MVRCRTRRHLLAKELPPEALVAGGTAICVRGVEAVIAHSRGAVPADQLLRQVHELINAAGSVVADLAAFLRLVLRSRAVLILPRPLAVAQAPRAGRNQVGATSHIHIKVGLDPALADGGRHLAEPVDALGRQLWPLRCVVGRKCCPPAIGHSLEQHGVYIHVHELLRKLLRKGIADVAEA